ncbi:uncharacterized protein LOC108841902 [Raphanus sativus]|uniref:Uncharacterized protein LOC108841902 n=1 Tax=Raphanus sativus TaxID=3726 RepID=A0A6J0MDM2_RAPSA|nr:uncharacterized protein LOC108841902 [Raphanus sativus]
MASSLGSGDPPGSNTTTTDERSPSSPEDEHSSPTHQKLEDGGASVEKPAAAGRYQNVKEALFLISVESKFASLAEKPPVPQGLSICSSWAGSCQRQDLRSWSDGSDVAFFVKKEIEICIRKSMFFEEAATYLEENHQIDRNFTKIVWEQLHKENLHNFSDYYSRCKPAAEARGSLTWCELLSQSAQFPNLSIYTQSFTIGFGATCDFILRDWIANEMMCKISKHNGLAVLEVIGNSGPVLLNGSFVEMNFECLLQSGDELGFGSQESCSFIFRNMYDIAVKGGGHQMPSAVTGASILASLQSFRKDLSPLNSSSQASSKSHEAPMVQDGVVDGMEVNSSVNNQSESISSQSQDSKMAILDEKGELVKTSQQASTSGSGSGIIQPSSIFREYIQTGIVEGKSLDVSFESFPYYLSENTKAILIAASHIHLTQKEFPKYAYDFTNLSPRILLSGPAGSEIYQEMLSKALAKYFKAKLLIFDSHTLGALTAKEIESLDDGLTSDKSCTLPRPYGASVSLMTRTLTKGDRVRFYCHGPSTPRAPSSGAKGKVVLVFGDDPSSKKVGVRFDKPIPDGVDLGDLCEKGHGFFCDATDLRFESSASEDLDVLLNNTLFEVVHAESRVSPFILFLKNIEKIDVGNAFKSSLEHLPKNVIVIGSQTQYDNRKKKDIGQLPGFDKEILELAEMKLLTNPFGNKVAIDMPQDIGQQLGLGKNVPEARILLTHLFGNKVTIDMPQDEDLLTFWNQLDRDAEYLKRKANVSHLRMVMRQSGLDCDGIETLCMKDLTLQSDSAEKIIGWALSDHIRLNGVADPYTRVNLSLDSIKFGIKVLQASPNESTSSKNSPKDIETVNELERFSSDAISYSDIGVSFKDIGALEDVKDTLMDLVVVPLKRPELFRKGQLIKPCKGILLFGPPGTGKTMLAKAVATEAGANFINISPSSIVSEFYGGTVKNVRAVFSLASKKSPSIIFVDEADSILGQRGSPGEQEATRRMRNEFMMNWDGLLTRETERVMVLAATNRPFDLDEAVIRRLPHRLMVGLPDAQNRAKILRAILAKEDLSDDVDLDEVARMADGYSGSDLKNLCLTAARRPVKEILEKEKTERVAAMAEGKDRPAQYGSSDIRAINMQDFTYAQKKMCASVSAGSGRMEELEEWNNRYGEGGSRKKTTPLSYFM